MAFDEIPLNAFAPTFLEVSLVDFIVMVFSLLHPENAAFPIFLILAGSVIFVSFLHLAKAFAPIEVTFLPMATDFRFLWLVKALSEIPVTL